MDPKAQQRLEQFVENTYAARHGFFWQETPIRRLGALLYAAQDRSMNTAAVRQCLDLIKENAGLFSYFRGNFAMTVATLLSLGDDPQGMLRQAMDVYEQMKQAGFRSSDYLVIAAYQIAANAPQDRYDAVIRRSRAFYDGMRSEHFLLTGQDDYIFSAMLGLSDIDVAAGTERLERHYRWLREEFPFVFGDGIQALAQVLVLGGDDGNTLPRVTALRDALRRQGLRLDRTYTLSSLGVLALLPVDVQTIVSEVEETAGTLAPKRASAAGRCRRKSYCC